MFSTDLVAAGDSRGGTLSLASFAFRGAAHGQGQCPYLLPSLLPPEQPLTLHHPCARLPTPTGSPQIV